MAGLYFEEFEVGPDYHHEFSRTGLMHCKPKA
jgi:hypothetical protein